MKSLVLPDTVASLHANAFENCTALADVLHESADGQFQVCDPLSRKITLTEAELERYCCMTE